MKQGEHYVDVYKRQQEQYDQLMSMVKPEAYEGMSIAAVSYTHLLVYQRICGIYHPQFHPLRKQNRPDIHIPGAGKLSPGSE